MLKVIPAETPACFNTHPTRPLLSPFVGAGFVVANDGKQQYSTSRDGRMSRALASLSGRSRNPKIAVSSPELGRVKSMSLKLILVTS